jgi:DNA ligase-1
MKDFAALFTLIDESTKTSVKTAALANYFYTATPEDRLWSIALFTSRRLKRTATATRLREWASEVAGLPDWLFEESNSIAGDLAKTIALVLPAATSSDDQSTTHWITYLKSLSALDDDARKAGILAA